MITVSHPTFCCVGVGVVVEVGLGCDNKAHKICSVQLERSRGSQTCSSVLVNKFLFIDFI